VNTEHMVAEFPMGGECVSRNGARTLAVCTDKTFGFLAIHADTMSFLRMSKELGGRYEVKVLTSRN
jgi:hypothetical protein